MEEKKAEKPKWAQTLDEFKIGFRQCLLSQSKWFRKALSIYNFVKVTIYYDLIMVLAKHAGMYPLMYYGFIRFMSHDQVAKMPIVFSHAIEILA